MKKTNIIKISVLSLWLILSITFATLCVYYNSYISPEAAIALYYALLLMTFPMGLIPQNGGQILENVGIFIDPSSMLSLSIECFIILSLGFIQWFIIVPFLFKKIKTIVIKIKNKNK